MSGEWQCLLAERTNSAFRFASAASSSVIHAQCALLQITMRLAGGFVYPCVIISA